MTEKYKSYLEKHSGWIEHRKEIVRVLHDLGYIKCDFCAVCAEIAIHVLGITEDMPKEAQILAIKKWLKNRDVVVNDDVDFRIL